MKVLTTNTNCEHIHDFLTYSNHQNTDDVIALNTSHIRQ